MSKYLRERVICHWGEVLVELHNQHAAGLLGDGDGYYQELREKVMIAFEELYESVSLREHREAPCANPLIHGEHVCAENWSDTYYDGVRVCEVCRAVDPASPVTAPSPLVGGGP